MSIDGHTLILSSVLRGTCSDTSISTFSSRVFFTCEVMRHAVEQAPPLGLLAMLLTLRLENATALGSRIPPYAVLLHVNNTPVKLKIVFAI